MAKQTKITIETDSLLILRGRNSKYAWCPQCAAEAEMVALDNVGVISNAKPVRGSTRSHVTTGTRERLTAGKSCGN